MSCAQQQILGDVWCDVEFVCWSLHLEGIFHNFSCRFYFSTREDRSLVGDSNGVPTSVVCGANTGSASTVDDRGGDRAIFHAAPEVIVVDTKDILAGRGENVSGVGNCVWFA